MIKYFVIRNFRGRNAEDGVDDNLWQCWKGSWSDKG